MDRHHFLPVFRSWCGVAPSPICFSFTVFSAASRRAFLVFVDIGKVAGFLFGLLLLRPHMVQLAFIEHDPVNPQATVATFKAIYGAPFRCNERALKKYLDGLRRCGLPR